MKNIKIKSVNIRANVVFLLVFLLCIVMLVIINFHNQNSTIYIEDFKRNTGEIDDTMRIQRAVDQSKKMDNAELVFSEKKYYTSSEIKLNNLNNISIKGGNGNIIFQSKETSKHGDISAISINNSQNVNMQSLKVSIENLGSENNGIKISKSKNIQLKKITIQNAGWIGIAITDIKDNISYNIEIANSKIEYCRFGIWSNGKNVVIKDKTFISNHWSKSSEAKQQGELPVWNDESKYYDGIIIKGSNWEIRDSIIVDNGQSGIYSGATSNGLIKGNNISNNWNKGIDFGALKNNGTSSIHNINIQKNHIENNKTGQVHLYNTDQSSIDGNKILVTDTKYASVPSYVQPAIILNEQSMRNLITQNKISQNYDAVAAIFINNDHNKSIDNQVSENTIDAQIKYNINTNENRVED